MIQILSLQLLMLFMDGQEFLAKLDYGFFAFFCNIIKVNHFLHLYYIITFNLFIFTYYIFACSNAYVSIISIDCILLSSFELKTTLLISSVKTLYLSLLNLCCVFNIGLFFLWIFYYFFWDYVSFTFCLMVYFILKWSCF